MKRAFLKSPLFIALAVAMTCVLFEASQAFDHMYWNLRYKTHSEPAPQSSVIVSLDGGAGDGSAASASSTEQQARLLSRLIESGADQIYLDYPAAAGADPVGDSALFAAIGRAGDRLTMVNRAKMNRRTVRGDLAAPRFMAPVSTRVAISTWDVNIVGFALKAPSAVMMDGSRVSSLALSGGAANTPPGSSIYPDYAMNPKSIPIVAARQVLDGRITAGVIASRKVYVTSTNPNLDTNVGYFGHGWVPSAMLDISAASARSERMLVIGGYPFLALFIITVIAGRSLRRRWAKYAVYTSFVMTMLILPAALIEYRIMTEFGSALIAATIYLPARLWQKWRLRVQLTSSDSGLPNIEALAADGIRKGLDVVALCVGHYEQMLASLPREQHGECAKQITRRIAVTSGSAAIYDNGNGHFVWLVEPYSTEALAAQFEGLKALFSSPVLVDSHVLDANVHFGIDRNAENSAIKRIKSAIASSTEAQARGKLYEEFGRQRMDEAPWELSLHARIDEGLRNGDIWLAFQAKYDLRSGRIDGAETLIRWTDPVRGTIPPDAFILQAERAGRIDTITYWVLEKAILASRDLAEAVGPMHLAVNLSAWMVDQPTLISHVSDIVRSHKFDCSKLTFEVTETFGMTNRDVAKQNLAALRQMGFRLSIDDFGTGQASLAYLSEIPCDEIKLDKQFIQAIDSNGRDRTIVSSIIKLAHALGQEVVAEGVEKQATLEMLRQLDCDIAQGYLIGRPVAFEDFVRSLLQQQVR